MSKALREKAIARGVCSADATDEQAEAAIAKMLDDQDIVLGSKPGHTTKEVTGKSDAASTDDILAAVGIAALPADFDRLTFASELSRGNLPMSAVYRKITEKSAEFNKATGAPVIRVTSEARDSTLAAARDAMLIRANAGRWDANLAKVRDEWLEERGRSDFTPGKPSAGAMQDRRLHSLPSLARICLKADGYNENYLNRLSNQEVAQLALGIQSPHNFGIPFAAADGPMYNTTGMFASVMLDVSNNSMRSGYNAGRSTFDQWMKRGESLPDFRKKYQTLVGELADPKAIPENGEFPETTMQDEHESYRVEVWGSKFSISIQSVINDNIGAFTDIPAKQGRSMKRKQNRLAYQVLKDNGVLQDTGALFNATAQSTAGGHANLTTGAGAPAVSTLNALELKMLNMIGPTGSDNADSQALNITPSFIIIPPALLATVEELLASQSYVAANTNSNIVNRWQQRLQIVYDAELGANFSGGSDTAWYLAANPGEIDTIEYAFLQGWESPQLQQMDSWNVLGREYRMFQAFGVKAIDYRGLQKHAGA